MIQNMDANCALGSTDPSLLKVWWMGWRDAWAGRGFPFRFDQWRREEQLNYEFGRLFAVNVKNAGLAAPEWYGTRAGVGEVSRLCDRSVRKLGDPLPIVDLGA